MTSIVEIGREGFDDRQHRVRVENFLRVSREYLGLADPVGLGSHR